MSSLGPAPTNATQAKERLYSQLAGSLGRMSRALAQTSELCALLEVDLNAMRVFAGLDAAKFMTVAAELNPDQDEEEQQQQQREESVVSPSSDHGRQS